MKLDTPRIRRLIKEHDLHYCLECGKCSASCPRTLSGREYSPRMLAQKLMFQPDDLDYIQTMVWECLTCGLCTERCPSGVDFNRFILEMREALADDLGILGYRAHDGALHSWMRIMTSPDLEQDRLGWLTPDLATTDQGPVAFFTGCLPYFDVFFSNIEVDTLSLAKDSIRLLNHLGTTPVLLGNERCCGHDLLWTGDWDNFQALCRLNYEEFRDKGVQEVITSCPECYQVLAHHLPRAVPGSRLKVTYILDLLDAEAAAGRLSFQPLERKVTYQDPCRLGRGEGCYEPPRNLISRVEGLELAEMANSRQSSICCGNNAFVNCDAFSKRIQVGRLGQAKDTGADLLLTACPKCQIHLTCAMRDPVGERDLSMEMRPLVSLLAGRLRGAGETKE